MVDAIEDKIKGKVPICIRKDYIMYLEFFREHLWFHININRWTAEVKRSCQRDFALVQDLIDKPIVALVREDDIKLIKFAQSNGWLEKCQIVLLDGSKAFIYASKA